jgi:hypothetical protein
MKVQFENVGREKKSWVSELSEITSGTLTKAVKKQRAIGARFPDFEYDEATNEGAVYSGFARVGTFRILKDKS